MWHISHKCSTAGEDQNYASMRVEFNGMKLTRMVCPTCREEMFLVGHEVFDEAIAWTQPGFAILRTHKTDA